ncbi:hypothetical protein LSH36_696g01106 [Paralvinella palmiformis]|uniref:Uncharacterized protein n=1 Tax=Paralvinella palmiformis TaxID=53620 RepID=A0AAD9J348_9ANNE|nr:hypothetical protein LSH36_696g01106 [Paralvinella palmiformis]
MLINWTYLLICVSLVIYVDGTRGKGHRWGDFPVRISNPQFHPKVESELKPEIENTTPNNEVGNEEQDFEGQQKLMQSEIGKGNKSTNPTNILPAVLSVIGILIITSAIIIIVWIVRRKRLSNSSRTGTVKKPDPDVLRSDVEKQISEGDTRVQKDPSAPPENVYTVAPGGDNPDITINQYSTVGYDVATSVESSILDRRDPPDTEAKMYDNPGYCPDTEAKMYDSPGYCPDTEAKMYDNPGYCSMENKE